MTTAADTLVIHDEAELVERSLDDLASSIRQEIAAAQRHCLEHVRAAGVLLRQARDRVAHGEWSKWVRQHCHVSERTARAYMQVAERWAELEEMLKRQRVADLPFRSALKLLAAPKHQSRSQAKLKKRCRESTAKQSTQQSSSPPKTTAEIDEQLNVTFVEHVCCVRFEHSSGVEFEVRSIQVFRRALTKMQQLDKQWANAQRKEKKLAS